VRVKVAECSALFFDRGKLVWDDYLGHRQFAITAASEAVLRFFADWHDLLAIADHDLDLLPVARHLLESGLLVAEGSAAHEEEERVLDRWRAWGPAARHYHFAARNPDGTRYLTLDEDRATMVERGTTTPPPAPFKAYPDQPFTPLPEGPPSDADWPRPGLLESLYARRSTRSFDDAPLTLDELGAVLGVTGGIVDVVDDPVAGMSVFKTSPSAGARDPVELYVHVTDVVGLEPGVYHFAPSRHGLEAVGPPADPDALLEAVGGQPWLASAPVLLLYTAVLERSAWRYDNRRAYRDVVLGLGHTSQTALLVATAMGLGAITATAVNEEALERLLGCDPAAEPVLAVTALGRPRSGS
jgi:SagB-type dehydrogenase family enzyme